MVNTLAFIAGVKNRLTGEEKGATAVEYGIMVALIAVVIIVAVTALGGTVKNTFSQIQCSMTTGKTWSTTTNTCN